MTPGLSASQLCSQPPIVCIEVLPAAALFSLFGNLPAPRESAQSDYGPVPTRAYSRRHTATFPVHMLAHSDPCFFASLRLLLLLSGRCSAAVSGGSRVCVWRACCYARACLMVGLRGVCILDVLSSRISFAASLCAATYAFVRHTPCVCVPPQGGGCGRRGHPFSFSIWPPLRALLPPQR